MQGHRAALCKQVSNKEYYLRNLHGLQSNQFVKDERSEQLNKEKSTDHKSN